MRKHNAGHIGCCRDDGNFQGITIDESQGIDGNFGFNYIPDQAQPLDQIADPSTWRGKRRLTVDEYEFYYRKLDDNNLSLPARIAMAFVLAADLKKLYPATPKLQKDNVLESFIAEFDKLTEAQKKKVYGEAYAFDYYLMTSSVADFLPANVVPYEASAYDFQKLIEARTAKQQVIDQVLENKMMQDKKYQQFKMEESQKVESSEFDAGYPERMAKFILENLELFLTSMFSDEYGMLEWSEKQLQAQKDIYQGILNEVQAGTLAPEKAMDEYRTRLNAMRNIIEKQEIAQNYNHPILKYVKS